jgi:hypothetical protein
VVRVSSEVRNGATRFRVGVQATSIQRAISLVSNAFYFAGDVRVIFPSDPEGFFVEEAFAKEGLIKVGETQEELAA